jgi:capsular exopolysaccharide synthesis family protein
MTETELTTNQRIWPILWRGKYVILASVLVMVALSIAYTFHQSKVYQATGIIQVNLPTSQPGSQDTTAANQGLAQNYAQLIVSSGFLNTIRNKVKGGHLSIADLKSRLTANNVAQTALVQLQATGSSPGDAQTVASEVINGFLSQLQSAAASRTAQEQNQLQQAINDFDARIVALAAGPTTATTTARINSLQASRNALIAQSANLVANGVAQQTSATVSAPPVASSSPISPRPLLNVIAGLLLGILLGVVLAYVRDALRSGIESGDAAGALVDLPVLASIPLKPGLESEDPTVKEAYGVLHTNLLFSLHRNDVSVVTFVGANAQVGKSSIVEGLADASVRSDRNILIVDGDMRASTLSKRLGYSQHPGIVDVLNGAIDLEHALVELRRGLWLLPAHESLVNPPTLLSGQRMRALNGKWRERFDVVLIDTPPIAGLADGLILSSLADVAVLVVRTGLTKPRELIAAKASLEQTHTPIVGLVVFEEVVGDAYYPYAREPEPRERDSATVP